MPLCERYLVFAASTVIVARLAQPVKTSVPMVVTPLPMLTLLRLVQPLKALFPMLVTLFGIIMLVRLLQF